MTLPTHQAPNPPTFTTPSPPTQNATIHGEVTYTPGDGAPLVIPPGPVELIVSPDSTTLSWSLEDGTTGSAAIPKDQYAQYLKAGKIQLGSS